MRHSDLRQTRDESDGPRFEPRYRVMVASKQGIQLRADAWESVEVWSTWRQDCSDEEARASAASLINGGVKARIIHESQYHQFCETHRIA